MPINVAAGGLSRLLIVTAIAAIAALPFFSPTDATPTQDPQRFNDQVQTIFLINQQRRAAGVLPLR